MGSSEIGRWLVGDDVLEFLGIGTTMDFFHCVGIQPVIRDILNNLVKEGVILAATDLSILAEIPS